MSKLITLTMKPIRFYSKLDEISLSRNLESIKAIKTVSYVDRGIMIAVDPECSWEEFKDILSLFLRYDLDLKMLRAVVPNEEVEAWFISPDRDWHRRLQ